MTPAEILRAVVGMPTLVVGDVMLDEYIEGRATRISPEAPVMVIRQSGTRAVPGGAANVAKNMVAFGARSSIVGLVGVDPAGQALRDALVAEGIGTDFIADPSRPTTRKTRVLANHHQQVLRIDHEDDAPASPTVEAALLEAADRALGDARVVLVSDYRKGAVTAEIVRRIIASARRRGVPVVANAKPGSVGLYEGATLVSLNRYEAGAAIGLERGVTDDEAEPAAREVRERHGIEIVLVTLGASGMVAVGDGDVWRTRGVPVEVYDEAGAGDTAIATVALGLAAGARGDAVLRLAAHAAAAVVAKVGVAVPSLEDLERIRSLS